MGNPWWSVILFGVILSGSIGIRMCLCTCIWCTIHAIIMCIYVNIYIYICNYIYVIIYIIYVIIYIIYVIIYICNYIYMLYTITITVYKCFWRWEFINRWVEQRRTEDFGHYLATSLTTGPGTFFYGQSEIFNLGGYQESTVFFFVWVWMTKSSSRHICPWAGWAGKHQYQQIGMKIIMPEEMAEKGCLVVVLCQNMRYEEIA